jgi:leucyl/phenylalanyl-tRNA--protein transferase
MSNHNPFAPTPLEIISHFALGYLPDFLNKSHGPVGWCRWSHRGIQFLDKFYIPRKQRPYVHSPRFELRFNTAFAEVLRECANPNRDYIQKRSGESWITPGLMAGLLRLHERGYAHSFETWQDEKLVGGIWGVQLGGLITMSSMFNHVSNASKFAMAQTMMHLQKRGFSMVDMGMVPDHLVHFGAEWVPRWKYESMLPGLICQPLSLVSAFKPPMPPWRVRTTIAAVRLFRAVRRRLFGRDAPPDPEPASPAAAEAPEPADSQGFSASTADCG